MSTEVVCVSPEMLAADLAQLFVDRGVSTVAVLDSEGKLQGIVTEADLIRRLADEDERPRKGWLAFLWDSPHAGAERYARSHAAKAGELMTREVVAVGPADSAAHIARLMEEHGIRRIPVTEGGRLLGLINRADLVRALVSVLGERSTPRSDEEIRQAVLEEVNREEWAKQLRVDVQVRQGVVMYFGVNHSEATSRALRVLAENIPGVRDVVDNTVEVPVMLS
ncbi:CBS domain-containing protein [Roseomonas sp. SSH11]|uniref:CBS domain-containing protein n=1 Tax=Pararoseomonas baculiformis TaxID=2820812 RepID=A0ABS4AKH3_9PROT|nr:CBS domain-containing protein [Pararoseomonas baculiformis]MBP0447522.1 CBS domain-containing protein [Pararoseomonas baculiformis]